MMFDINWNILSFLGGSGLITLLLISVFAPGVITVVSAALAPIAKAAGEGFVYLVKGAWVGIKDILDNVYTILFVVALGIATFTYGSATTKQDCDKCIAELRKEYRFVKKTEAEKKAEKPFWQLW